MATSPETRLKRFLHYGSELQLYQPGDRLAQNHFVRDNLTAVSDLLADETKTPDAIVAHIVKAYSDGYSAHPAGLVFALAVCARQKESTPLRVAAYNAVRTVCKSLDSLFLFVKFMSELAAPNSGWGRGLRRVVCDWYASLDAAELARLVSSYCTRYGWRHRDLVKSCHFKTDDTAKAAVIRYAMFGLKDAREKFGDRPEAQQVLAYLQAVEDLKHSQDEQQAARLVEIHGLTRQHVPAHFHKSREVWSALVPGLPLPELLQSVRQLGRMRLLKGRELLVGQVLDSLQDQAALADSRLHPAQVLVALRNYQASGKAVPYLVTAGAQIPVVRVPPPPPPNLKIIECLHMLLHSSFKMLVATGMRYLVALDVRPAMWAGRCAHCVSVSPAQAALLQALCLVKAERDVTVLTFLGDQRLQLLQLDPNYNFAQAEQNLKQMPGGDVDLTVPITWALNNKKAVDVFVILTDTHVKLPDSIKPSVALGKYRTQMNLPNTKYVTCAFASSKVMVACPSDPRMLDIVGFDCHVPSVIEGFSRGAF
ncbi:RNA-binding protein Ro60-like [Bacillus rossius redtenbacheri]|uniref:RNA-binding protein Ro60-like n=1 Tax=Bacillus rossius redtenbacheri TaxID=93214 RepID=UPI002FDDDBE4